MWKVLKILELNTQSTNNSATGQYQEERKSVCQRDTAMGCLS